MRGRNRPVLNKNWWSFTYWTALLVQLICVFTICIGLILYTSFRPPFSNPTVKQDVTKEVSVNKAAENLICENKVSENSVNIQELNETISYLMGKLRSTSAELKRMVRHVKESESLYNMRNSNNVRKDARCNGLKIATYNLWNLNPPWPKRRNAIAGFIKERNLDVIAFQEIRHEQIENGVFENQLLQLKKLTSFEHHYYEKVQEESNGKEEGLGLLSVCPIVETSSFIFQSSSGGPTSRKCIQVLLDCSNVKKYYGPNGLVNVFMTHFTLGDYEQCVNVIQLIKWLNTFDKDIPQVLLGDMNTYFDFEWPMDFLTSGFTAFQKSTFNPCYNAFKPHFEDQAILNSKPFDDVWEMFYPQNTNPKIAGNNMKDRWWGEAPANPGYTFPISENKDAIQDASRPDRILIRNKIMATSVALFGADPISLGSSSFYASDHRGVEACVLEVEDY
eukprot:TRINITY_DN12285_c0_g1_i1.p1 TRINITY_DN12285_c0_g1~~TRINITY_DN12285_c0_g1_i1.p1  ORF type:complete len:448 (-),score=68.84 TRINITY_DN12285_c0_g1_i1:225-1568(-)